MTFEARFVTKLEGLSIDEAVFELRNAVDTNELNEIVKSFLKQLDRYDEKLLNNRNFDFLIGGRVLRLNVEEHLKLYSDEIDASEILNEKQVEVEYLLALQPPKPLEAISHEDWVSCVHANDTHMITGSYDNSLRIFTLKDRKLVTCINDAHEKPITRVKFINPPGDLTRKQNDLYFMSCGHDEVSILRKFNLKTTKVEILYTYRGHNRSVNCVDISDDLVVTGSFDRTIRLWSAGPDENDDGIEEDSVDRDKNVKWKGSKKQKTKTSEKSIVKSARSAIMTLTGHHESVTGVKWLKDSNEFKSLASCSMDRSICIWDIEVGECKRRLVASKPLLGIDFCPERNLFITASTDRFVRIWDARAPENANAKAVYTSHTAWISSVAIGKSSSNHFISGGYDNLVKLWDLRSPKACLYDLIGHHDKVLDVNWSNSSYVLSGSADATLKIFSTETSL